MENGYQKVIKVFLGNNIKKTIMGYKMNGFSGFGNSSPAKQKTEAARQDNINAIDAKIEDLHGDLQLGKITQEEYDKRREALRTRERKVKKARKTSPNKILGSKKIMKKIGNAVGIPGDPGGI